MHDLILDRLAKRAPRFRDDAESRLNREIKRSLYQIKCKSFNKKNTKSARGGLQSMGACGVFVKEGDIYSKDVIVKASYILSDDEKARARIREHIKYAGRDKLGEDENKYGLYSDDDEPICIENKVDDFEKAPHMFNIIISPNDGDKLDLKDFTRDFIKSIETDLKTKVDWVAGNHYDTDNPHVHLLIKGLDDQGKKLLMKRDYISRGLRARASQIAAKKLGLRSYDEVVNSLDLSVAKSKKCALDRVIKRHTDDGVIKFWKITAKDLQNLPIDLLEKRLDFLESKGLAHKIKDGRYEVKDDFLAQLKELERTSSIIQKLGSNLKVDRQDCEVLSAKNLEERTIKGHVIERGYVDDMSDAEYLLVKSKEKKFIYVELEKYSEKSPAQVGEFVKIDATKPFSGAKNSDLTIDKEARENGGIYDAQLHERRAIISAKLPPGVSVNDYVETHVKRLEVLARKGVVKKLGDGRFSVPKDYLDKLSLETKKSKECYTAHIKVTRLNPAKVSKPTLSNGLKQ